MQSNGSFHTQRSRAYVFSRLTDPAWLVRALDFPSPSSVTPDGCVVKGDVGFGPLHGSIEIHIQIAERDQDARAVYRGWGSGVGSQLTLEAAFDLSDAQAGGTTVVWSGSAAIDGPMSSVADTLFRPLSRRNFEHLQQELEQREA